jgi:hypothetical protein
LTVANARHFKAVPGRKTDVKDAEPRHVGLRRQASRAQRRRQL